MNEYIKITLFMILWLVITLIYHSIGEWQWSQITKIVRKIRKQFKTDKRDEDTENDTMIDD